MTEFWLIRHGQTDWNLAGRFQGHTDIPLNSHGLEQARELAARLAATKFNAIYSSDLKRASQTADLVGQAVCLPVIIDPRLREICQGDWEGMSLAEVRQKYEFDPAAAESSADSRAPGGESVNEVAARMVSAASDISRIRPDQRVLLVSHGLAVAALFCVSSGIPLARVHGYIPENATPMIIQWQE